ncbi:DUF769 domain-containing protein [Xylella fastidiosa]|uniref:DUF769 domain-containing protein n=1 Tax=Xylella fastidiosa TaxID=2371 RepID=UPI000ABD262D
MKLRIPLCVSICVASLLLSACSTAPVIDPDTGKPIMMAGPKESRDLTLEHFQVSFFRPVHDQACLYQWHQHLPLLSRRPAQQCADGDATQSWKRGPGNHG